MIHVNTIPVLACVLTCTAFLFNSSAEAQQYKTASDTTKLNKEYGQITLDIAKLNTKLIAEKNKTVDYQSKSSSTASEAVTSEQKSKDQAQTATDGSTTDTEKAVKDAKKANRDANDAKDAVKDEKDNQKKIGELTTQIDRKQKELADLDSQRAVIMGSLNPVIHAITDSVNHNP